MEEAGTHSVVMVASGDVWLDLDPLSFPQVTSDIVGVGMRVTPEVAQHFGVYFVRKAASHAGSVTEQSIAFFLQKPTPAQVYRHAAQYDFYVDTGLWLFSAAAIEFLFRRCGWESRRQQFIPGGLPEHLDLYTEIGAALGCETRAPNDLQQLGFRHLSASVVPLEDARFFHVGSTRQLLESSEELSGPRHSARRVFSVATPARLINHDSSLPIWLDGAIASTPWRLDGLNVITGGAATMPGLHLRQEQCLEIAPIGSDRFVVRPYHIDDRLRGKVAAKDTTICGLRASDWLHRRGLKAEASDIFNVPLYPVVPATEINQALIDWFFAEKPATDGPAALNRRSRLAAAEIPGAIRFDRYFSDRDRAHADVLIEQFAACLTNGDSRVFEQDFAAIAALAARIPSLQAWLVRHGEALLPRTGRPEHRSRLLMLLSQLAHRAEAGRLTARAHFQLQRGVLATDQLPKAQPHLTLKEDQIVWGRSPVRLDLAGGWTDTPPYCFEQGGAVLNVAVLLNGQPPIQVFVRPLTEPVINLRSIDLGAAEIVKTYSALESYRDPRAGFSLPKAALALAGFHPAFSAGRPASTLRAKLRRFGGGLEISLLSAVPKGSGLGTSSILAATILGTLNRACDLGWDAVGLYNRVLGVEQLLTTGGGWQDQAGALFRGIKLIETSPGPSQAPRVRYLPEHLLGPENANRSLLLYYTGITRLAKGILKEIVHDMFLGRFETQQTLSLVRSNAEALFSSIQRNDAPGLRRCIGRSWNLNKRLDPGTTTPAIEGILEICGADLASAKLLGAGGGGYMLLCASDANAGDRIRARLEESPPNRRARFIDFQIADSGLEVTVS